MTGRVIPSRREQGAGRRFVGRSPFMILKATECSLSGKLIVVAVLIHLIAQSISAQTKVGAHCSLYDSRQRYHAFIAEDELQHEDIPTLHKLFKVAQRSLLHNGMITVDIKACVHESFDRMGIRCTEDEVKSAWVGYNHRFLHPIKDGTWVTTWGEETDDSPDPYGTLLGKYLYDADVWLKETMFSELIPRWNKDQRNLQEEEDSISIYFEPNIQASETQIQGDVYWTIEKTEIRIVGDGLENDPIALMFVNELKDDPYTLEIKPIKDLMTVFKVAFLADKANRCPSAQISSDQDHDPTRTPTSHPVKEGTVISGRESYTLYGGVRIDSSFFEASKTHSDDELESIGKILNEVPQDKTEWRIEVGDISYVGITLYE